MKKVILTAVLGLGVVLASAQKMKDADVPAAVKTKFSTMFPGAKVEKWEKEDGNFEAEFDLNKVETSAVFDASGNHLQTETELAANQLPKGVYEYVAANLKGSKIKEASKITDAKGTVTYEAEISGTDYIFDANGAFVKKQVENDKDDDDDKKK